MCKRTRAIGRPAAALHYWWRWLINLWKWLSRKPDLLIFLQHNFFPLPLWRNNRSIMPFCCLTDREKWGSDWRGFPASRCCVSGLSVQRETLMDCRSGEREQRAHMPSHYRRMKCCCFSQEDGAVKPFVGISVCNTTLWGVGRSNCAGLFISALYLSFSLMLRSAATENEGVTEIRVTQLYEISAVCTARVSLPFTRYVFGKYTHVCTTSPVCERECVCMAPTQ